MRRKAIATSILIFSLSVVSTTFVLITLTSPRWSVQKYYISLSGDPALGEDWVTPICYATRSPFYRCDLPNINETATPMTCSLDCQFYAPYGYNKTSCRLATETNGTYVNGATTAGAQECQQVHYAGNLQIAASVFTVFGLILLLPLTLGNFFLGLGTDQGTPAVGEESAASRFTTHPNGHTHHHPFHRRLSPYTPYIVLILLFSLYASVLLQIFAQFFGVLAMTIDATPTPYQAVQYNRDVLGATPWIVDKALSTYATVAWTSSLACAALVGFVYRTPRFTKLV